jgi:hypothetical protein
MTSHFPKNMDCPGLNILLFCGMSQNCPYRDRYSSHGDSPSPRRRSDNI